MNVPVLIVFLGSLDRSTVMADKVLTVAPAVTVAVLGFTLAALFGR